MKQLCGDIIFKKQWMLLIDRDMNKQDLRRVAKLSSSSVSKLSEGMNVNTDILVRICNALECDISDIMEMVPDEGDA